MKISFGGFLTSTMIRLATRFGPKPIRNRIRLDYTSSLILEQIGIEIQETDENCLEVFFNGLVACFLELGIFQHLHENPFRDLPMRIQMA